MDVPRIRISEHSDEWRQLVSYINARIHNHRKQLESEMTPLEKVPAIRARIAELSALMQANKEEKPNEQS